MNALNVIPAPLLLVALFQTSEIQKPCHATIAQANAAFLVDLSTAELRTIREGLRACVGSNATALSQDDLILAFRVLDRIDDELSRRLLEGTRHVVNDGSPPSPVTAPPEITIRIDANQRNRAKILEKLNQHGGGLKFELADKDYEYIIQFQTVQSETKGAVATNGKETVTGSEISWDTGFAIVYDSHGEEMFRVKNEAWWSEDSAINGTAKKIVKRLKEMRRPSQK